MNKLANIEIKLLLLKETKPLMAMNWGTIRKSKSKKEDIEKIKTVDSMLPIDSNQQWVTVGNANLETKEYLSKVGKPIDKSLFLMNSKKQVLAHLSIRCVYVPLYSNKFDCILPSKMEQVESAYQLYELHNKIWKKGYLFQKGGDCIEWKKQYCRLKGLQLIGYSNKKSNHMDSIVDLSQLWSAEMLLQPQMMAWKDRMIKLDIFELEFKDGVIIYLGVERKEGDESESHSWMESLGNIDSFLAENPVPDWLLNCQK